MKGKVTAEVLKNIAADPNMKLPTNHPSRFRGVRSDWLAFKYAKTPKSMHKMLGR